MSKFLEEILDFSKQQTIPDYKLVRFAYSFPTPNLEFLFEELNKIGTLFYFSKPAENYKVLGIGNIENFRLSDFISNISKGKFESGYIIERNSDIKIHENIPLVLGAEKFPSNKIEPLWEEFSSSKWFIPQILLYQDSNSSIIVFQYFGNNPTLDFFEKVIHAITAHNEIKVDRLHGKLSTTTEIQDWTASVNRALNEIRNDKIEKIVLARKMQLRLESKFSISSALEQLQKKFPDCTIFAYQEISSVFFGATPEKLFSLRGNELETEALAGSIARGFNLEEDLVKGNDLLNNSKEMNEHKNVLNFLLKQLETFSHEVLFSVTPQVKKLSNIQHMQTPIKAKLKDDFDILEFQKTIHPTPAVCGLPQKKALELIKDLEYFDRGLYAGVIGWFNEKKRAEFVVGIRSALLRANALTAFAGCGIVEGSDPVSEFNETELKFKPILSLLENEIINQS